MFFVFIFLINKNAIGNIDDQVKSLSNYANNIEEENSDLESAYESGSEEIFKFFLRLAVIILKTNKTNWKSIYLSDIKFFILFNFIFKTKAFEKSHGI